MLRDRVRGRPRRGHRDDHRAPRRPGDRDRRRARHRRPGARVPRPARASTKAAPPASSSASRSSSPRWSTGVRAYAAEVRERSFPAEEHCYRIDPDELERFREIVDPGKAWDIADAIGLSRAPVGLRRRWRSTAPRSGYRPRATATSSTSPRACRRWSTRPGIDDGLVTVFVAHSTAAISLIEYEPGGVRDLREVMERLVPTGRRLPAQPHGGRHERPRPSARRGDRPIRGRAAQGRPASDRHLAAVRAGRLRRQPARAHRDGAGDRLRGTWSAVAIHDLGARAKRAIYEA